MSVHSQPRSPSAHGRASKRPRRERIFASSASPSPSRGETFLPGKVESLPFASTFGGVWARTLANRKDVAEDEIPQTFCQQFSRLRLTQRAQTSGDQRFNAVLRDLDGFNDVHGEPLLRSPLQRDFHMHMANAAVAAIYGPDFDASRNRILEKYQWESFRQEVMIITSRGEGKTYAVAMFIASALMNCPGLTVAVFAVSMRASENVLRLVKAMLLSCARGSAMMDRQISGKQSITLRGEGNEGDIRVVTALPNSPDTTRGVHADMMIVDEASFVDPALMMETIIPTTTKKRTCVIMISTPKGQDNIYTWLTDLVDTSVDPPVPLFNVVRAGKVCQACVAADKAFSCTHMRTSTPAWKSESKIARMKILYADRPDLELMEIKGVSADSERAAFTRAHVDAMFGNVVVRVHNIKCVYIAVDPSGGGSSEFAAVAFVEDNLSRLSVCLVASTVGCDSIDDDMAFITSIWGRVRERFPHCPIVFIPESNLGKEASHLEKYVSRDPLTVTMQESARGWYGVCKTDRVTMEMYYAARTNLAAGTIYVTDDCIGIPTVAEVKATRAAPGTAAASKLMLKKLRDQLLAYRWEPVGKGRQLNGGETRCILTGKRSRQNDDLCIAFLMVIYWRNRFWLSTKPSYEHLKRVMGRGGGFNVSTALRPAPHNM